MDLIILFVLRAAISFHTLILLYTLSKADIYIRIVRRKEHKEESSISKSFDHYTHTHTDTTHLSTFTFCDYVYIPLIMLKRGQSSYMSPQQWYQTATHRRAGFASFSLMQCKGQLKRVCVPLTSWWKLALLLYYTFRRRFIIIPLSY